MPARFLALVSGLRGLPGRPKRGSAGCKLVLVHHPQSGCQGIKDDVDHGLRELLRVAWQLITCDQLVADTEHPLV
jgi:hypothetical protein